MKHIALFLLSCCFFSNTSVASALSQDQLIKIAEHKTWHSLIHYKETSVGYQSYVESKTFFNAGNGSTSPFDELKSTITKLQQPSSKFSDLNNHPQCKFPARLVWLKQQGLSFPKIDCPNLNKWQTSQPIESVSVIFASGYMSNPASLYGHMLLKLNRGAKGNSKLLDYSLNYGAIVPENENGLVYITKGLFGGYEAGFSDQLYYRHQHNYAETELRDIWEYKLNFSADKINLLSLHIWELMGQKFIYYFADENCAFHIAQALEVITAQSLTDNLSPWVIPVTIFERLKDANLIDKITHVPSRQEYFYNFLQQLSAQQQVIAKAIAEKKATILGADFDNLTTEQQKQILETLLQYVDLLLLKNITPEQNEQFKQRLLKQRIKLPIGKSLKFDKPNAKEPHLAQAPSKFSAGYKDFQNNKEALSLGFRLAYFDTLASDIARVPHSNLEMLDLELTVREQEINVERLDIIDIQAYNPSKTGWPGDGSYAWKLKLGYQAQDLLCTDCSSYYADGAIGKSTLLTPNLLVYGFINSRLQGSSNHYQGLIAGAELGLLADFSDSIKGQINVNKQYQINKQKLSYDPQIDVQVKYEINREWDIRLSYAKQQFSNWQLSINHYWH